MRLVILASIVAGSVVRCNPPPEPARTIGPGHMPSGAAYHLGGPDVILKVTLDEVSGEPTGFEQGSAESTDLAVGFVGDKTSTRTTTVRLTSRSKQTLKVDLWLSQDGQRFEYTSSCPIAPGKRSFETWAGDIPWVYVSNPRFLAADAPATCD
jgi:hypothetical protein